MCLNIKLSLIIFRRFGSGAKGFGLDHGKGRGEMRFCLKQVLVRVQTKKFLILSHLCPDQSMEKDGFMDFFLKFMDAFDELDMLILTA